MKTVIRRLRVTCKEWLSLLEDADGQKKIKWADLTNGSLLEKFSGGPGSNV